MEAMMTPDSFTIYKRLRRAIDEGEADRAYALVLELRLALSLDLFNFITRA